MLTIFISIPWFSPAFKAGGPVQSIRNLVEAMDEGYTFYIFCSNTDLHGLPLHITQTDTWCNYNAYTKVWYAGKSDRSKNLVEQVGKIQPDQLLIIGLFDWHFNLVPLFFCKGVNKILSVRGMLHPGALSQKPIKKRFFLQALRFLSIHTRSAFHATDITEAGFVKDHFGIAAEVFEAGNFPRRIQPGPVNFKEKGALRLLSIGIVGPMKNILLVLQSLSACPGKIQYDIYGPVKDLPYWEKCLQEIKKLPGNINVQYHKEITPDQVPGKLYASHVFIMPSKSENFGHAIYEALHAGLPVITSRFTPWNELEANDAGVNVDTETSQLSGGINFFANLSNEEFTIWRKGASAYAENAVDEEKLREAYEEMFKY
jgi:glycosyltransferase involved in cell wall biosynthesis